MSAIDFASERVSSPIVDLRDRDDLHARWKKRAEAARNHRRRFEKTWMESQLFAAGKQHVNYNTRLHRTLVPDEKAERKLQTHDVLMQFVWTVLGALATDDFRPQFLTAQKGAEAQDRADYVNKAMAYGWDSEWDGDQIVHEALLFKAIYGTAAIRCRYDRSKGALLGEQVPHDAQGQPIFGENGHDQYEHMGSLLGTGQPTPDMRALHEGAVVWEPLSPWNLLPPPGVWSPRDFRWEIVVRPVAIDELKAQFPEQAHKLKAEPIESMDVLGTPQFQGDKNTSSGNSGELEDHVLVYTGYERPGPEHPQGQTVVFTSTTILGQPVDSLPYPSKGGRPASTGITYFTYWPVPNRFWGRGFIEPGMGPQRTLNKRETQFNDIVDRGLPYVIVDEATARKITIPEGLPLELVIVPSNGKEPILRPGMGPGAWMGESIDRLRDAVADALGVKRVALGENPPGVQNYSQLALLKDQEAQKLGPISQRFHLGLANVSTDSLDAMRNWPAGKKLIVVASEDQIEALSWDKSQIPDEFLIRPAKKGAQPRGVGAELAKVDSIWQAALNAQIVVRNPIPWLSWYAESLEASKALELPEEGASEQRHKAALENLAMHHGAPPPPVAPYDIAEIHVPEHIRDQELLSPLADAGDPVAQQALAAIEQHKQMHLAQAQANVSAGGGGPQALPPGPPSGPPQ